MSQRCGAGSGVRDLGQIECVATVHSLAATFFHAREILHACRLPSMRF
ncbi:hypothetical protein S1001342_02393 [Acetobacter pasteurianus subsp. pasteurianus]|uniref:Uncharacterized protein n=1 Tax=Acetobacter pasteurianus subsp. pasteurianus TaxID=481145 RepID=A0A1Y0Y2N4_ACEPA|nr:hypothetical protein S1001342_02393 [Acetobacter pasteurianus subsp. pasteurianus]